MQINYLEGGDFEIRTKDAKILLTPKEIDVMGFKIRGAGEYERKGVFIEGVYADGAGEVFVIRAEGVNICYPGIITGVVSDEASKQIGDIDILFLPLGEMGSLSLKDAEKLIAKIDPRVVIPMLYQDITPFSETNNIKEPEIDSYKFKKTELPEEERKFVILKPSR